MPSEVTGIELDGVMYDAALTKRVAPVPDPPPLPADPLATAKAVRIGTWVYPLTAVNPTPATNPAGAGFPGCRGTDQLVAYRAPVTRAPTNVYGREAVVLGGRVAAVSVSQTVVPGSGYVLSGHGAAATGLTQAATVGAVVELLTEVPAPGPSPALPRQLSVYLKMWPSRLPGLAAAAKPGITEVRMAFLQGSPPSLVGWGSQTQAQVAADAAALRARGVAVTASAGGSGGRVDTKSRDVFVRGVAELHAQIGLDRIDWDVESSALVAADVVAISQQLHDSYGLAVTMTPNGGNVGQYLPVAVQLHRAGFLAAYGQQFYDAPVSLAAAMGRIQQAIDAGLPASVIQVGMMVGPASKWWPMDTCDSHLRAIRDRWPDILGAYLWSESHAEVPEWARRMAAVLA